MPGHPPTARCHRCCGSVAADVLPPSPASTPVMLMAAAASVTAAADSAVESRRCLAAGAVCKVKDDGDAGRLLLPRPTVAA